MSFIAGVHTPAGLPLDADTVRLLFEAFDEKVDTLTAQMTEVRTRLGLEPPAELTTAGRDDNLIYSVAERVRADLNLPGGIIVEEVEQDSDQVRYVLADGGVITVTVDHTPAEES